MAARKKSAEQTEILAKARKYLPAGHFGNISLDCVISDGRGGRGVLFSGAAVRAIGRNRWAGFGF